MSTTHTTDACVIGAGPAGIFAVFQLGLVNLRCHVVDSLEKPRGQCAAPYQEKPVYDIPTWLVISGQEQTDRLMLQIRPFNAQFHLGQTVVRVEPRGPCEGLPTGAWRAVTNAGARIDCKELVIATSGASLMPDTARQLPRQSCEGSKCRS